MARWTNPDWLSTGQVARLLHLSIQTVIRMCERGDLPFTRPSGSSRAVTREALRRYLDAHPDLREYAGEF